MATIKDIADEVGISKAAVSRILNHKGSFSSETIAKVERVARRLNYTSITALQQEDAKSSKMIAAIFPAVELPYYGLLSAVLEKAVYNYGYSLMLCGSLFDREKEEECFRFLQQKKIDGIILGSYTRDATMISNQIFPVVTVGYKLAENIPAVRTDNYAVGRIAARHLLSKGCKKMFYITSFPGDRKDDLRYLGFKDELSRCGYGLWIYHVDMDMQLTNDFSSIITQMVLEHPDADGCFAETDALAMNCLRVFQGLGYRIPDDMKVIGYGNPFFSTFSNPQLTIVRENTKEIAKETVALLMDMIEYEEKRENYPEREIVVPVSLEEHKTT